MKPSSKKKVIKGVLVSYKGKPQRVFIGREKIIFELKLPPGTTEVRQIDFHKVEIHL